jgi:hypothetical protein
MTMSIQKQQEIALKLLKQTLAKNGISPSLKRDLCNTAKEAQVSSEEIQQFIEALLPDVLGSILNKKVIIQLS